jgi:hypothetical protein
MAKGKSKATSSAAETLTNDSEFEQLPPASDTEKVSTPKKAEAKVSPNDELELAGFNYEDLTGQSFKDYVGLVGDHSAMEVLNGEEVPIRGSLQENKSYDFVLMKAVPVMQARFPGMKDTPFDYVGIRVKENKAVHSTRIPVKTALEFNRQIMNAHSRAGHGKYYFLKK